ncbi:MAG: hypothetical protein DRH50_10755 [Deltaproteobacteria bacterium]|nr:MAG: hypothetical protein DRH50_10755 [Deltaproteobacteria bacterium]
MTNQSAVPVEPSLHILLTYLESEVWPFKRRLAEQIAAIPTLRQSAIRLQEQKASLDEICLLAQKYCDDDALDQRVLDVWFDYHKAREYCIAQWQEWESAAEETGPMTRINVLGLWHVCASLTETDTGHIPILPHIDRLIWHLAHLLDDIVDARDPDPSQIPEQKVKGIVSTLRVLCEVNRPGSRDLVSKYYRRFKHDYLSHEAHAISRYSLVEQLYHKLIPDTITAEIYNDIMEIIVGSIFDTEAAKQAMREAMYVWQVLDDWVDFAQDIHMGVANIALMCLQQAGEKLPQSTIWPIAALVPTLLPGTVSLLRQVFCILSQWLRINRPDVMAFLSLEFKRVFPEEWYYILDEGRC